MKEFVERLKSLMEGIKATQIQAINEGEPKNPRDLFEGFIKQSIKDRQDGSGSGYARFLNGDCVGFTEGRIYTWPFPVYDGPYAGQIVNIGNLDGLYWRFENATKEEFDAQEEVAKVDMGMVATPVATPIVDTVTYEKLSSIGENCMAVICYDVDQFNFVAIKFMGRVSNLKFGDKGCNCVSPADHMWNFTGVGSEKFLTEHGYNMVNFYDYLEKDENAVEYDAYLKEIYPPEVVGVIEGIEEDLPTIIGFDSMEEARFFISLTIDNSPEEYSEGELIEMLGSLEDSSNFDWIPIPKEYYFEHPEEYQFTSFRDYIVNANLQDQWLYYLVDLALLRGFDDGVTYKWGNMNKTRVVVFPFALSYNKQSLADATGNFIFDGGWPEVIETEKKKKKKKKNKIQPLTMEELSWGEIYTASDKGDSDWKMIFRFQDMRSDTQANCISYTSCPGKITLNDWCLVLSPGRKMRLATLEEKKKLTKKEVKSGYFHGVK